MQPQDLPGPSAPTHPLLSCLSWSFLLVVGSCSLDLVAARVTALDALRCSGPRLAASPDATHRHQQRPEGAAEGCHLGHRGDVDAGEGQLAPADSGDGFGPGDRLDAG